MIKDCEHVVAEFQARIDEYKRHQSDLERENAQLRVALNKSKAWHIQNQSMTNGKDTFAYQWHQKEIERIDTALSARKG